MPSIDAFRASLSGEAPPSDLPPVIAALWWAHRDAWDRAHGIVQDEASGDAAWIHAYLHRVEGDLSNAGYWYRQAGKPVAQGPLWEELVAITAALVG